MTFAGIMLIITATITALMAGFFFSYSISVSWGLAKLADKEFLKAMQSINREVQNPIFFVCFFGALIMLLFATFQQYGLRENSFTLLLIATLFYLIGVFGATVLVNVPLNNKLELFDSANATEAMVKQMRNTFERRWNFWNNIRTVASLISIIFVILACVFNKAK